ncbi:LOW QUALITY PROTEIN: SH2 domain-containing protein 2A [Tachyglossus aculeatus]|uniref:LOW QUALITY PROTEIN: SH2 domain-containing protein 2A n=1 Tax=Tachyglossus aculeatus TaxID=9261 RepID=UPI0018F6CDC4|nr:LOW QUALITY PROTEIN: SH2 domain-containing protein 2A [Tachyglossus aculeatus]
MDLTPIPLPGAAPSPTFSTFHPQGTRRGASGETQPSYHLPGHTESPPGPLRAPVEGDDRSEGPGLRAETLAWFERTQASELLPHGVAPAWFHGFVSRREAEQRLQEGPHGVFLVRFSESGVGFVLSYRGQDRCRHFLLAQGRDGQHVVLGEERAFPGLQALLDHYGREPLSPYGERLGPPCLRQQGSLPAGLFPRPSETSGLQTQGPPEVTTLGAPQYAPVCKRGRNPSRDPPLPSLPMLGTGQDDPREQKTQAPPLDELYSPVQRRGPGSLTPPASSLPIYHEPDDPIAFYAMGWEGGGMGRWAPQSENVYSEVKLKPEGIQREPDRPLPAHSHGRLRPSPSQPLPRAQELDVIEYGQPIPPSRRGPQEPQSQTLPQNRPRWRSGGDPAPGRGPPRPLQH